MILSVFKALCAAYEGKDDYKTINLTNLESNKLKFIKMYESPSPERRFAEKLYDALHKEIYRRAGKRAEFDPIGPEENMPFVIEQLEHVQNYKVQGFAQWRIIQGMLNGLATVSDFASDVAYATCNYLDEK